MKPYLKIDLEKQYLYLPMITKANQKQNIFNMMENIDKKTLLEEVGVIDNEIIQTTKNLRKIKIETIKQLIYNHKPIPEKWIMNSDYQGILEESMKDQVVLNYLLHCVDYRYKDRRPIKKTQRMRFRIKNNNMKSLNNKSMIKVNQSQIKQNNTRLLVTEIESNIELSLPKIMN